LNGSAIPNAQSVTISSTQTHPYTNMIPNNNTIHSPDAQTPPADIHFIPISTNVVSIESMTDKSLEVIADDIVMVESRDTSVCSLNEVDHLDSPASDMLIESSFVAEADRKDEPSEPMNPVIPEAAISLPISPLPVRKVLTIIPIGRKESESVGKVEEPLNPSEKKEGSLKKRSNQKLKDAPVVVEPEQEEVAPVLGRKTKQKRFKAAPIKKKVQPRQNPVPSTEEPLIQEVTPEPVKTEPVEPKIEQEQIETMGGLDLNEFISKIDHMQLLARTLSDLVQVLETESNNSDQFIRRFEAVAQSMTPTQFVKGALDPLIATAHRLAESLVAQYEREKHLETQNLRSSPWTSSQWEDQLKVLVKVIDDLESSRDVLVHVDDFLKEDSESFDEPESEPDISPDVYLETILSTIHDLVFQALPRSVEKGKKRKAKGRRVINADPLYCLAAATGLDPSEIARMSKPQQRAFVKAIQKEYPDPVKLITTILESSETIDFHQVYEKSAENAIEMLVREVFECKEQETEILRKFEMVKEKNDEWRSEIEEMLGVVYPSDDEWIDED
jgi:hypothetical protein